MAGTAFCGVNDGRVRWISPARIQEHRDEQPLILDTQPDVRDYIGGHIPGAIYADEHLFRMHIHHHPACWILPDLAEQVLAHLGVTGSGPVIVYGSRGMRSPCSAFKRDGAGQALVAYSLARYGVRQVYLLNGGLEAWINEGRPLDQRIGSTVTSRFPIDMAHDFSLDYQTFAGYYGRNEAVLLDTRSAEEYRNGHVPGAVNIPWQSLMAPENPMLLPHDDPRPLLKEHGVTPDRGVVCYGTTGRTAASVFLLLRYYLRYPAVRLYEGSFIEWHSHPGNPVATGGTLR